MPQTQTAMAAALERAGMDTAEARLRMIIADAMKKHHGNAVRAVKTIEREVDGDLSLIREAFLQCAKAFGGQRVLANHADDAAEPRNGAGQAAIDSQFRSARPVREPSAQQRAATAAVAQKISVLNTFKVAGRSIGDWRIVAAKSEGPHLEFHGRVLRELTVEAERAVANIEPWMTFRDVLKDEQQIQRCIQRASELSNAA